MTTPVQADGQTIRDDLSKDDAARVAAVTAPATNFSAAEQYERMAGGAGTSLAKADRDAFSHAFENLSAEKRQDFVLGNGLFKKLWVSAPSSTQASDGLGPLYNARSCHRCHINNGRGHPPEGPGDRSVSMFLRLSVPPRTAAEQALLDDKRALRLPEPTYGGQLQELGLPGLHAEGRMVVAYETVKVELGEGEIVELRRPSYTVAGLSQGAMRDDVMLSPRVAPPMIGLGLLEAIHSADIVAKSDPDDRDGDGISGRINLVRDKSSGALVPGRFGWKASIAGIEQQSAEAFSGDIGISTPMFPDSYGDCTAAQTECRGRQIGVQVRLGDTEAPDPILDLVAFYARNLAVPARRDVSDPDVLKGKALFHQAGCAACHTPKFVTDRNARQPEHRFQLIWPYSDMLLHDMGEALSDHRPVGDAAGSEWRTAPLWGIGLTHTVNGHTYFLHDGRARSLIEAIMWHGGEARQAREAVTAMSRKERQYLIRFLESL
ncbi:c-type cytochrome [Hwanghaeella grinnelliae]|uniref:C-type cytochrome n=2 Tax=Hwanghaeella grinnelliae TaxID=2500179 RepID=A0A3S2VN45_9PROT|nr:c-type cytochrome [Hwanghaeella grinnelliae]